MTRSVLFGSAFGATLALTLAVSSGVMAQETDAEADIETSAETSEAQTTDEPTKGEKRLAKLIEGRVAGEPVRCIRTRPSERLTVIDDTAYVYGSGNTIYVQRTKHPERIDRDDVLVSRPFSASQLCRLDMVTTIDRVSGIFTGAVFFEEFVPYTREEKDAQAS